MRTISPDGYIRLSSAELGTLAFTHLVSGLDEDIPACGGDSAARTAISGYTEWLSNEEPKLSIGWDWVIDGLNGQVNIRRYGEPRSNCMLIDPQGKDLGHEASNSMLALFVDTLEWQAEVTRQIATRYSQVS